MRTRGKRVTAEIVLKRDVLIQHIRVDFRNYSSSTLQDFESLIQKRGLNILSIKGSFPTVGSACLLYSCCGSCAAHLFNRAG